MHDGCNARAWVQVRVERRRRDASPAGTQLLTPRSASAGPAGPRDSTGLRRALWRPARRSSRRCTRRRSVASTTSSTFYTWGDRECCLPGGATRATLREGTARHASSAGDVLDLRGGARPRTGEPADADPAHRHAVRLTQVRAGSDGRRGPPPRPAAQRPTDGQPITEIEWAREDALPFPLCISARPDDGTGRYLDDVSVARGNIVLADHGRTVRRRTPRRPVPRTGFAVRVRRETAARGASRRRCCRASGRAPRKPLTQVAPYDGPVAPRPATAGLPPRPPRRCAGTRARLAGDHALTTATDADWPPGATCSAATPFAARVRGRGRGRRPRRLRFGDDQYGLRPARRVPRSRPTYRVGNGPRGNVGAEALAHVVGTDGRPVIAVCATRCRRGRRRAGEPSSDVRQERAERLPHAGARRHAPRTTPRSPSATRRCSAPPRRSAGPAAGARSS